MSKKLLEHLVAHSLFSGGSNIFMKAKVSSETSHHQINLTWHQHISDIAKRICMT